jgi:hypothetical protein
MGSTPRCRCRLATTRSPVTLPERGGDDVCPVSLWADDEQDDHDADQVRGRANCALV